eukprot:TRINITY_DN54497_c0_g1_i1.p1 TRINITY_DN54497_c0_g1~~TRINITY_DN54497_c0_g1_i1.p1  ORF type:complete len:711 (+),score=88.01 TRINITY_DN54497_c0_g1_i1:23-2134(+)
MADVREGRTGPPDAAPPAKEPQSLDNTIHSYSHLARDLERLLKDGIGADLQLVIIDEENQTEEIRKAHSVILSCRSEYFQNLLQSGMEETITKRIEITDAPVFAIDAFLLYVYTGTCTLTPELAVHLYAIGDKFIMDDLKQVTLEYIWLSLDSSSIVSLLVHAQNIGVEPKFQNLLLSYAAGHIGEITQEDFNELSLDLVVSILQCTSLSAREADVLSLVCSWARNIVDEEIEHAAARIIQSWFWVWKRIRANRESRKLSGPADDQPATLPSEPPPSSSKTETTTTTTSDGDNKDANAPPDEISSTPTTPQQQPLTSHHTPPPTEQLLVTAVTNSDTDKDDAENKAISRTNSGTSSSDGTASEASPVGGDLVRDRRASEHHRASRCIPLHSGSNTNNTKSHSTTTAAPHMGYLTTETSTASELTTALTQAMSTVVGGGSFFGNSSFATPSSTNKADLQETSSSSVNGTSIVPSVVNPMNGAVNSHTENQNQTSPVPKRKIKSVTPHLRQRKLELLRCILDQPLRYIRFPLLNPKDLQRLAESYKIRIITNGCRDAKRLNISRRTCSSAVTLHLQLTKERTEKNFEYNGFKFKIAAVKSPQCLGIYLHFQYYTYPPLFVINAQGIHLTLYSVDRTKKKQRILDNKIGLGKYGLGYRTFLVEKEFAEYVDADNEIEIEVDFPFYNGRKLRLHNPEEAMREDPAVF